MRLNGGKSLSRAVLLAAIPVFAVVAQNVNVQVGKRATAIPRVCESIAPASIEGEMDATALAKEADCKGSGDMLIEYTYVMKLERRGKDNKKGRAKEETTIYEVYIPTLKSGTRTRGVLLVTSRNGVAVPPEELERERLRAGERLAKEEDKIARTATPRPETNQARTTGMLPLGMYPRMRNSRGAFGIRRGGAVLDPHTFLHACELTLERREQIDGRETLLFSFTPRADALFGDDEKYIAQLGGRVWIDAQDRIVTRLVGWPRGAPDGSKIVTAAPIGERPPAVYLEMMRLPEGHWLPRVTRINGADYATLFDGIASDTTVTYSEYKRFSTETKDVQLEAPKTPS